MFERVNPLAVASAVAGGAEASGPGSSIASDAMHRPHATAARSGPSRSAFDASEKPGYSIIGTDLTILGEGITIISRNNLRVDGDVRGNVAGKEVVIGPDGSVTGTVSAENIEVFGGVRGTICSVGVSLHGSAQVEGEIVHETMMIDEGAHFEGRVRRLGDRAELIARLDPKTYAARSPVDPEKVVPDK